MTPYFCRTPETKDFPSSPWEYSSESGAIRIHETIFLENLDSEIFIIALGKVITSDLVKIFLMIPLNDNEVALMIKNEEYYQIRIETNP
jgi:hypothetical protein